MNTPLKDRIDTLKTSLLDVLNDCRSALIIKGVTVDDSTYKLSSIADYIRQIFQSDYNFIMFFNEIDQFGNPHVPNQGYETNGFTDYNPNFELLNRPTIEFNTNIVSNNLITGSGAYGICNGNTQINIESFNIGNIQKLNFNEISSIPEEFSVL